MSAGDNTRDDRWRPGLASSERRVREELADAASGTDRRVFSRELSFVPSQAVPKFDAHDVQTRALIAEQKRLEALRHGAEIAKRLDEWKWVDTMYDAAQKQAHLEPLIFSVQREPVAPRGHPATPPDRPGADPSRRERELCPCSRQD
jgi:hypothetical protein